MKLIRIIAIVVLIASLAALFIHVNMGNKQDVVVSGGKQFVVIENLSDNPVWTHIYGPGPGKTSADHFEVKPGERGAFSPNSTGLYEIVTRSGDEVQVNHRMLYN